MLWLLATVPEELKPEELQIMASPGSQFILTGERKTTPMNSAATIQDVEGAEPREVMPNTPSNQITKYQTFEQLAK